MSFYNPYNFIPAPNRNPDRELGDGRPKGHHAYHPQMWTGRIDVRMIVETPLLIPGLPRDPQASHKTYRTRVDSAGSPVLPPTSIKGMLRSAYESVTNSRFGVLEGHDERLAYRHLATEGLRLVPAIAYSDRVELMMGSTSGFPEPHRDRWRIPRRQPLYAAWLPVYKGVRLRYIDDPTADLLNGETAHAILELLEHQNPQFALWRVRELARDPARLSPTFPASTPASPRYRAVTPSAFLRAEGRLMVTNENTPNKHDERFFFLEPGRTSVTVWLTAPEFTDLRVAWRDLVHSYQNTHREVDVWRRDDRNRVAPPELPVHRTDGDLAAWSPHIYRDAKSRRDNGRPQQDASVLRDDTLCYARMSAAGTVVEALYPVPIARELYDQRPITLVHESLRPAPSLDALSPADRVFGWVHGNGHGAYRGQLRVSTAKCMAPATGGPALQEFERPLPLAILSAPKPQQARFYLADAAGEPLDADRAAAFLPDQRVRGRKVYPHQKVNDPDSYWQPPATDVVNEYARPAEMKDGQLQRRQDSQNRSIESWVRRKTEFDFSIDVVNLSAVEIGALLWLLTLDKDHFHRFGGGKPLGFGSVHLAVAGVDLANGECLRDQYRRLIGSPSVQNERLATPGSKRVESTTDSLVAELQNAFRDSVVRCYGHTFEQVSFVKAFLAAARGFDAAIPTHYPREGAEPTSDDENFRWFGLNKKALPRLDDDNNDPYFA